MTDTVAPAVAFGDEFARDVPELAIPWQAEAFPEPSIVVLNEQLASELGLDAEQLRGSKGAALLSGNTIPDDAHPVAQAYAGHQFGGYSPRLGDGRALLLGDIAAPAGGRFDVHLKGSGPTPFSRGGDGFAALGPMLREHLVSEAMHALGIPTTRSLAVVATGAPVYRETALPGAVLARVARSHVRVGSFQYAAASDDADLRDRLVRHAIRRCHPELDGADNPALSLFQAVVSSQAELIARWMLVGFIHGVMNTDNMTVSGETIDYGPCAFMEGFDPAAVYSSINTGGRYAYGNQPAVAAWNLARFAEALLPALGDDRDAAIAVAQQELDRFGPQYSAAWRSGLASRLGLAHRQEDERLDPLVGELFPLLQESHVDHTLFFRLLGDAAREDAAPLRARFLDLPAIDAWLDRWRALGPDAAAMDAVNPIYIPRNHLVEEALSAAVAGDLAPFFALLDAVTDPFTERPGLERFAAPAPDDFGEYRTFCGT